MIKCLNVVRYGMVIKLSQIIILVYDLSIDPHPSSLAAERHKNQSHVATASIKKPIHNVKERRLRLILPDVSGKLLSSSLEISRRMVEPIGIEPMT